MMYNKRIHDYFFSPKHVGSIALSNHLAVVSRNSQQGQGNIEFYMQCNQDRIIIRACFKTNGNPYVIASLEWICRQLEGHNIASVPRIDYQCIVKELNIPMTHYPIALRAIDVYKEALVLMNQKK
jgi:nitrogen fixation protein NifU and related proteins